MFRVQFRTNQFPSMSPVARADIPQGFEALRLARAEIPGLCADDLLPGVPPTYARGARWVPESGDDLRFSEDRMDGGLEAYCIECRVSEEEAARSGKFERYNIARVMVSRNMLAPYVRVRLVKMVGTSLYTWEVSVLEDRVVAAWAGSGHPYEWRG